MSNPWLKKNPYLSLWLSAANRMAGSLRGHAMAQAKRQVAAAASEARKEAVTLWSDASVALDTKPKSKATSTLKSKSKR